MHFYMYTNPPYWVLCIIKLSNMTDVNWELIGGHYELHFLIIY